MFLTLHLCREALQLSWCNCECKQACQKNRRPRRSMFIPSPPPPPLAMGSLGLPPPCPSMFANERNTCSIIIYRIICLFIILFFQMSSRVHSVFFCFFVRFMCGIEFFIRTTGKSAIDNHRRACLTNELCHTRLTFLWLWESVEKLPSQLSSSSIASCGLGHGQWASLPRRAQKNQSATTSAVPVKKKKKNTDSFHSACIIRHIQDVLHVNVPLNHLRSLAL